MPSFGELAQARLDATGRSHHDLARELDTSQGFVSQVLRGERSVPLDPLEAWLEALADPEDRKDRQRLQVAAWLTHAPEGLADYVDDLERRLGKR